MIEILLFLTIGIITASGLDDQYTPFFMSAPFSSFNENMEVNLSNIPKQAKFHYDQGVNLVWINGGMSQFQALSVDERLLISEEWVKESKKYGMEIVIHCTDLCLETSKMYAKHAESLGADYISFLPPFYQKPSGVSGIVEWLKAVTEGVNTPFFYYHIPGSTGVEVNVYDLVVAIDESGLNLAGIKFVDSHDKIYDFQQAAEYKDGKYAKGMMWAAEPKLAAIPFGARSIVLAEGFYAPYYVDMINAWDNKDVSKALSIQMYVKKVHGIVGGGGGKNVLRGYNIDLGPNRLPASTKSEAQIQEMLKELREIGFIPN